jgi:hypothetical protein
MFCKGDVVHVPVTTYAGQAAVRVYDVQVEDVDQLEGMTRYLMRHADGREFSISEGLLARLCQTVQSTDRVTRELAC